MRLLLPLLACAALTFAAEPTADELPVGAKMSYLDNGIIRVGVDLNHTPFPLHFNDFENFFGLLWALHLC